MVTLASPAPAGGALIALSSASNAITVPASITVAQGASAATFGIATSAVAQLTTATLSASYGGVTKTTTFTVNPPPPPAPPALAMLQLSPSTVIGGGTSTATVALAGPAPSGGAIIVLKSSKPSLASVPANVVVPAGATSASFTVTTAARRSTDTAQISATYAGKTRTATLTVRRR